MGTQMSASTVTSPTTMGNQGRPDSSAAVAGLIRFLETGAVRDGLFAPDVFSDLSLPPWPIPAPPPEGNLALPARGPPRPGEGRGGGRRPTHPRCPPAVSGRR